MKRKTTNSEALSLASSIALGGMVLSTMTESQFANIIGKIAIVIATLLIIIFTNFKIFKKKN
ncbi:MAG: hypothetical protein ABIC91_04555, partial [Nanoarchaeota archaeon]